MKTISPGSFKIITFSFYLFTFYFMNCERSTSPLLPASLHLTAEYVAVTEADLHLEVDKLPENATFEIRRGDSLIYRGALQATDTTVTDTALLPAHRYTYQATLLKNGKPTQLSPPLQITTMDTTSHDFQWEITEFPSPYGSGALYDVAIVNENDIWAVGEIYSDSAQPWLPYNTVHWDGQQWELKKIYVDYQGQPNLAPLEGVFSLPDGKIIFSSGLPYLPEGNHWKLYHLWDMGILNQNDGGVLRIWGTSLNNLYFAGRNGTIVHYDGVQWHRIESGTDLPITDIWGIKDSQTGEFFILCTAAEVFSGKHSKIFRINSDNSVSEFPWPYADRDSYSVWFKNVFDIFICGDGVVKINKNYQYHLFENLPRYFTNRVRGTGINDIYVAGAFGFFAHFSGINWWVHPVLFSGTFKGLDVKSDIAVAVGEKNHDAYIMILIRK